MTIPKIIASKCKKKILSEYPELDKIISSSPIKNTCLIVDMKTTLPNVNSEGVMRLSVDNFLLLHPLLKKLFSDLKEGKGKNIKQVVKLFQEKLKILDLTKQEILLFSAKLLIVLAVSGIKRRVKNGNRKAVQK